MSFCLLHLIVVLNAAFQNQNLVLCEHTDAFPYPVGLLMNLWCVLILIKALLRAQQKNRSLAKDVFMLTYNEIFLINHLKVFVFSTLPLTQLFFIIFLHTHV